MSGPDTSGPCSFEIQGKTVTLPVQVRAATATLATWLVPTERATKLVGESGLEPYGPLPGRSLISAGMIRYEDSDLGEYNEFALVAVVKVDGVVASFIAQLPVDQGFTLEAGRTIWGFPKFMTKASIETDLHGSVTGKLAVDGEPIVTLGVKRGLVPLPSRTTELDTYTYAPNSSGKALLRRTPFTMRTSAAKLRPGGVKLEVGRSKHPMAEQFRSLRLGRALSAMHVGEMTATFGSPVEPIHSERGSDGASD